MTRRNAEVMIPTGAPSGPTTRRRAEPITPTFEEEVLPTPETPAEAGTGMTAGEFVEPLLAVGSSAVAEIAGGWAGIFQALNPWAEEGASGRAVESVTEAMTYQPKTEKARMVLGDVGEAIAPVAEKFSGASKWLGDTAMEASGSPEFATFMYSTPTAIAELLGLKGLKMLRPGTKLIDDLGRPTAALKKAFHKRGLEFDNLSPEVRKAIPKQVGPTELPGAGAKRAAKEAEKALVRQIMSGADDNALAGLKIEPRPGLAPDIGPDGVLRQSALRPADMVVTADNVAKEAIKQGFEPGMVQTIKTASPATRKRMGEMSSILRQVKGSARKAIEMRPTDPVGASVVDRVMFVRDQASDAAKELNKIAGEKLAGKRVDAGPLVDAVEDALNDLDVKLVEDASGVVRPDFTNSIIEMNTASRGAITDAVDLLMRPVKPDALRFHKLKRMMDDLIDFNKKTKDGLPESGRRVLKQVRHQLNEAIRAVDPDYARVNDVLSESLGALDDFEKSISGSIDLASPRLKQSLGTEMRGLLSNNKGRIKLLDALDGLEDSVDNLGGGFPDNPKDLMMFADALDTRFGTTAKTGFAGQIEQATKRALAQGPTAAAVEKGASVVGKGLEKLRGVNDFNAFESIESLLKRDMK